MWRDPLESTREPLSKMQIFSLPRRQEAKASPLGWGLLSVLSLGYPFTLSPAGNQHLWQPQKCSDEVLWQGGQAVRRDQGPARWCVISPSQFLMPPGAQGLPGTPQEWEPSLHQVLVTNCSAGLSDCLIWATSWKRHWEKKNLKTQGRALDKKVWTRAGIWEPSSCIEGDLQSLQSFIFTPSLLSWLFFLLLHLLRQLVTEQLAIRKKSELIKLAHYRLI